MKKSLFLLACAGLCLAGCKDYLNITPASSLVEDSYFRNTSEVETGVINIYNALQRVVPYEINLTELRSDNIVPNNLEGDYATIENFADTPTNDFTTNMWSTSYYAIARANIVLKYLGNVTDADKKARFEGEARFARALMHFNLVRLYGDVPIAITTLAATETDALRRRPVAEVYTQIISDLQAAENLLPTTWETVNLGRATKGAARALLAKVYLTQQNYAAAKTEIDNLLAPPTTYQLLPSFATVFSPASEMNAEIIFAIRYKTAANGEGQGFSYDFSKDGATRGLKPPTDFQPLFVTADAVRRATSYTGTGATAYVNKFPDAANTGARRDAGTDWIVLRYGEVLLMQAEILNELSGPAAGLPALNAIRTRAGVPVYTIATLPTKAAFFTALKTERRLELAFENYRWYDLLRWNEAVPTMNAHFIATGRPGLSMPTFRTLYPVPQREIDLSKGVITQNTGY
ncbi:RagB/SusD family nutrient uptake outer membrane protein [Hymenobacter artigasi]|uniref:RagB/SusD family nutrient uptake outer membrane protein n=1 Tax=Hymenobacter artigasi TaxID=2719616 RepID=A0ABX1HPM0_9BACT|nr:RagB/SusD family nutrient uptake outer membrane protein [Hymenobacter artigasi]NKI90986.1 hypothetical protein [Hymenobacter artigasi]